MTWFAGVMGQLNVNGVLWGPVMIVLLVGTGLYLTIRLRFVQVRRLVHSIRCISGRFHDPEEAGDISHFQALAAALSATIGTGNIAGVATAIALGGPGAVFCGCVVIGTVSGLDLVWLVSDNLNALMAVPNIIGLLGLAGVVIKDNRDYIQRMREANTL
ncbi:MAG: alanine:cation symporter family protein [Candidatus Hydrogenedentes bacterium]|nr:alanine:cation symporter family protein [Candidatus Hydrogenedentota bacterium]